MQKEQLLATCKKCKKLKATWYHGFYDKNFAALKLIKGNKMLYNLLMHLSTTPTCTRMYFITTKILIKLLYWEENCAIHCLKENENVF